VKTLTIVRVEKVADHGDETLLRFFLDEKLEANRFLPDKVAIALLARIEAGDRARGALRMIEMIEDSDNNKYCPWCGNYIFDGPHTPDCPRQVALGLDPREWEE